MAPDARTGSSPHLATADRGTGRSTGHSERAPERSLRRESGRPQTQNRRSASRSASPLWLSIEDASRACERCQHTGEVEVHHGRNLKELDRVEPARWRRVMAKRRRKTLVLCADCHDHIHHREPLPLTQ
ncbi:hypothetical protein [Streptomyces griseorubiginosus]|uniref:HNH endonuclease n=1 Tax=Streptomyces griseorubiginosus TaxID=67304 RepID=UPI003EB98492